MTPEAQQIAIAKACGWKQRTALGPFRVIQWIECVGEHELEHFNCPDYLNDLNAMHEAEKTLIFSQRLKYYEQLRNGTANPSGWRLSDIELVRCSAGERAEAFLRTLGLWEET